MSVKTESGMQPFLVDMIAWREDPIDSDMESVRKIVVSTDFFSREEHQMAVELVQERLLHGKASGYYFIIAETRAGMIGYACFGPIPGTQESFDLYWIAVKSDYRGTGIGKAILARAEQKIQDMGGRRIYVETSSRDLYHPTHIFYGRCGYVKEAALEEFYGPRDDKFILVKVL
jgi:GNAT superfamily N-acetyltransferase